MPRGLAQAQLKLKPPKIDVVAELQAQHKGGLEQYAESRRFRRGHPGWCGSSRAAMSPTCSWRDRPPGAARSRSVFPWARGAGEWPRQLLTESTVLALAAGALAVLPTFWTARLLGAAIPANVQLPITLDFTPDLRVLGWGTCTVAGHRSRLRIHAGLAGGAHRISFRRSNPESAAAARARDGGAAKCAGCRAAVDLHGRARRRRPVRAKPRTPARGSIRASHRPLLSMRLDPGLLGTRRRGSTRSI